MPGMKKDMKDQKKRAGAMSASRAVVNKTNRDMGTVTTVKKSPATGKYKASTHAKNIYQETSTRPTSPRAVAAADRMNAQAKRAFKKQPRLTKTLVRTKKKK